MKKIVAFALSAAIVIGSVSLVAAKPRENHRNALRQESAITVKSESREEVSFGKSKEVNYTFYHGKVRAKGREIKFDVPPVIKSGTMLIPVRAVVESLGANVNWDAATNTVTITKGGTTIVFDLNGSKVYVNGSEVTLSMPAMEISNRTFVPIRFIAETLGVNINYDDKTGDVDIEDGNQQGSTVSQSVYGQTNDTVSQDVYGSDDTVTNSVYGEQD
ncbi:MULTISPECIES: copper amine oxidase N-terminal domain-containing protein [unclassified Thermoanaerobacterium]|uniref:copper amine oxidase N-terminal domain-containing protein n=1 Tax=unclassified Thermoanaerobacterium TaxID=2622527 RepID=UPI000A161D35|nr:copper amine oxidase N-terminal domain-containing protein [Thermoanaerobacterium sp. PSU-2]MDE4541387.1 copper amine oxidase N-terminal domain-containing protein [Thermoanaerobacterium sp. R66]ORX23080.1 copper amine oxidase [Thermoanaerobacterium sp. PSU-2]